MNYRKISEHIYLKIGESKGAKPGKKKIEVNIGEALEEKGMFPFVAGALSLFPRKTSNEAVKKYLVKEKNWKEIIGDKEVVFID